MIKSCLGNLCDFYFQTRESTLERYSKYLFMNQEEFREYDVNYPKV